MDELIVTREELKQLFKEGILKDTPNGWFYKDTEIEIIAIHNTETKLIPDITNADTYRLTKKEKRYF
jgi:hypothetical protein